jgi:hypothetical protein
MLIAAVLEATTVESTKFNVKAGNSLVYFGIKKYQLKKRNGLILKNT